MAELQSTNLETQGVISACLADLNYHVKLDDARDITAKASMHVQKGLVPLMQGDYVNVLLDAQDVNRGTIIFRLAGRKPKDTEKIGINHDSTFETQVAIFEQLKGEKDYPKGEPDVVQDGPGHVQRKKHPLDNKAQFAGQHKNESEVVQDNPQAEHDLQLELQHQLQKQLGQSSAPTLSVPQG